MKKYQYTEAMAAPYRPATDEVSGSGSPILRLLLYYDIFAHPLTFKEICNYCHVQATPEKIKNKLIQLQILGYIIESGGYYTLQGNDIEERIHKRIKGAKKANELLNVATKYCRFISFFPFVAGIYLSGSLSKGFADEQSDIDYFIITTPGRLWLCRTLLVLYKKIFLLNSHKRFCVNYFIDTQNLEIPDKNIFTATELATMLPACNPDLYGSLIAANQWLFSFFPNFSLPDTSNTLAANTSRLKLTMEKLFNGKTGEKLDTFCFRITLKTWKRKFRQFSADEFDLRLRSKKNVSKHHPLAFQERVLSALENKIKEFEKKFNVSLQ